MPFPQFKRGKNVDHVLDFPQQKARPKKPGTFAKGFDARRDTSILGTAHRRKGTPNAITRDLKRGILDAAELYGSNGKGEGGLTGYLFMLAGKHPKAFAGLLSKVLPMTINTNSQVSPVAINIIAVPHDQYLSPTDIAKLSGPALEPVEVDPDESQDASVTDITEEPEE
jgi:hypothetical protein